MAYCFVTHANNKKKYGIMLASLYCLLGVILDSRQRYKKQSHQYHEAYITETIPLSLQSNTKKQKQKKTQT